MLREAKGLARRFTKLTRRIAGRRRFIGSVRSSDVFIVTYPKSGTTWVAFFLASIIADRKCGDRQDLNLRGIQGWVPGVNPQYLQDSLPEVMGDQTPRIFKAHSPVNRWFRHVVYVVRDPRDVMVSYYYHFRRRREDFDLSIDEFIERNEHYSGDWGEHVRGWLSRASEDHVLLVRYEDLHEEPLTWFRRIASACGIDLTDEELQHYVDRSSFRSMQKAEKAASRSNVRDIDFIRQGNVGDWRSELSEASVRLIEERYGDLMTALGYTPSHVPEGEMAESGQPVPPLTQDPAEPISDADGRAGPLVRDPSIGARRT